jgi:hypothetical protein
MNDNEMDPTGNPKRKPPWNKGKLVGPKPPLRPSHVWSIRTKLQVEGKKRDLALFNLAIDSKLRGCDVVAVRVAPDALGLWLGLLGACRRRERKRTAEPGQRGPTGRSGLEVAHAMPRPIDQSPAPKPCLASRARPALERMNATNLVASAGAFFNTTRP